MRREQTVPETRLWRELRGQRCQRIKCRRQKVIGPYIADFSSREPMLVIEIDGDTHAGQEAYDRSRTVSFEEQGYRVIRFTHRDVLPNMDGVLEQLMLFLAPPLPTHSPDGERAICPSTHPDRKCGGAVKSEYVR